MGMFMFGRFLCIFVCFSAAMVPVEQQISLPSNIFNSNSIQLKLLVRDKIQDHIAGMLFSYMHSSFEEYRQQHPIKYGLMAAYIPGKYIHNDINRLYMGDTLLHKALMRQDVDLVTILLFLGANPLEKNAAGITGIELAKKLKLSSCKSILDLYLIEQKKLLGRTDLESLHQSVVSKMIYFVTPLMANQGLNSLVESLQMYGTQHPFLSRVFMYGVRGHKLDTWLNTSCFHATFLQRCIDENYQEFAKILLYLGADPLGCNMYGYSAFDQAVKTGNLGFLKMFWLYVSSPLVKSEMYPLLEKYKVDLLSLAQDEYLRSGSTIFLRDVATYFNLFDQFPELV